MDSSEMTAIISKSQESPSTSTSYISLDKDITSEAIRHDIGLAAKYLYRLTDSDKIYLLENPNKPDSNFNWPSTEHNYTN